MSMVILIKEPQFSQLWKSWTRSKIPLNHWIINKPLPISNFVINVWNSHESWKKFLYKSKEPTNSICHPFLLLPQKQFLKPIFAQVISGDNFCFSVFWMFSNMCYLLQILSIVPISEMLRTYRETSATSYWSHQGPWLRMVIPDVLFTKSSYYFSKDPKLS